MPQEPSLLDPETVSCKQQREKIFVQNKYNTKIIRVKQKQDKYREREVAIIKPSKRPHGAVCYRRRIMGNTNTKPFGVKDKIGYMCGDIANDFTFIFASSYVMVFYTKVMGVSAGMVGTMFLLARCLDAFTDIGMGRIVDNSKPTKNGRIRPWILRMCAFVALASFMMYQSVLVDAP